MLLLCRGTPVQNIMIVYGIEFVLCCNVALFYRTIWKCVVWSVFFDVHVMWLSSTEHFGSVWYGVCSLL